MEKIFKSLGDRTRLEIIIIISLNPDICLCDIEDYFKLSNSNLSRHLKELEQAGLIKSYKKIRWKHYQLSSTGELLVDLIRKLDKQETLLNEIKTKSEAINCIKKDLKCQ